MVKSTPAERRSPCPSRAFQAGPAFGNNKKNIYLWPILRILGHRYDVRRKTKIMYKPLLKRMIPVLAVLAGLASCSRELPGFSAAGDEGGILVSIDQDDRVIMVKSDDEDDFI